MRSQAIREMLDKIEFSYRLEPIDHPVARPALDATLRKVCDVLDALEGQIEYLSERIDRHANDLDDIRGSIRAASDYASQLDLSTIPRLGDELRSEINSVRSEIGLLTSAIDRVRSGY
jgi:prefoldin subunit 5